MDAGRDSTALPPSAYGQEDVERHRGDFDPGEGRYRFIIGRLKPRSRVLEIGCCLGLACRHLAALGHEATGVDISPEAVAEGRRLAPRLDLRCLDAEALGAAFPPASFDAVVASEVIEHVLRPRRMLRGAAALLKPEGRLLLTTQNSNGVQFRLRMLFGRFRWDPTHLRLYSRGELAAELAAGGFAVESMTGIPVNSRGPGRLLRRAAALATALNPNLCWTWGVVARPLMPHPGPDNVQVRATTGGTAG